MDSQPGVGFSADDILPLLNDIDCYHAIGLIHATIQFEIVWPAHIINNVFVRESRADEPHGGGVWTNDANPYQAVRTNLPYARGPSFISEHIPPDVPASAYWSAPERFGWYKTNHKAWSIINGSYQLRVPNGYRYTEGVLSAFWIPEFSASRIKKYIADSRYGRAYDVSIYKIPCTGYGTPERIVPASNQVYIYTGTAAPPPPPPPSMNCCSCNDIATILAENAIAEIKQHQATRDLIDRRMLEGLREINKMLQNMQIDLNLQPVIDRLNELEANLWNGLKLSEGGE